jgi:hypothetical protein
MSQVVDSVAGTCANCRQPLTGRFCAHCGEQAIDPAALTVRHFVTNTVVDELTHVDRKFWTTLANLMFRPGFLSAEYAAGRRRAYIKPVRVLLATIVLYALLTQGGLLVTLTIGLVNVSIAPTVVPSHVSVAETIRRIDRFGVLTKLLAAKSTSTDLTSDVVRERFHRKLNQFVQPLSFANVVLLSLALFVLFRRRRRLLLHHAVFSIHLMSFILASSLGLMPAVWLLENDYSSGLAIIFAVSIWQFAYVAAATRRFYFTQPPTPRRPRLSAFWAASAIYLLNSAFLTIVQMAGGAIALRSL